MQSGIVWPPIRYVTPGAASLCYRNCAEIFVLMSVWTGALCAMVFDSAQKLLGTEWTESESYPSHHHASKYVLKFRWHHDKTLGERDNNRFKQRYQKKCWSIYLSLPGKLTCFFYWGCQRQMYKNKRETKANKETIEKAAIGSVPLVWCWLIMKCEATSIQHGTNFRPVENLYVQVFRSHGTT